MKELVVIRQEQGPDWGLGWGQKGVLQDGGVGVEPDGSGARWRGPWGEARWERGQLEARGMTRL